MSRIGALCLASLFAFAAVSAHAQSGLAGGWSSCQELIDACKQETAETIWQAAYLWSPGSTVVGTCYVHDRSTCPNCACYDYVKLSYLENPKGWDGGTGCMGVEGFITPQQSHADAAAKIKQLCESGACCCPQVEAKPCPLNPNPVRARDPLTGSCCTFPNICSKPSDWQAPAESWQCP